MPARPDPLQPADVTDEKAQAWLEEAEENWYGDSAFFGAMAYCPAIFDNIMNTFESFGQGEHIDGDLLELMRLKIAEVHQCAYCATVRTLEVRESVKSKEDAIFEDIDAEALTRREYLTVLLAEQLSENPHRLTDEFFKQLKEVFSEKEIIELLLFGSLEVGLDRFCIALELQPTDESAYPDKVEYPLENPHPKTE